MMEILEKLPGITIERYAIMDRNYTFAGFDSSKQRHKVTISNDINYRKGKHNHPHRPNSTSSGDRFVLNRHEVGRNRLRQRDFLGRKLKENHSIRHDLRPNSQNSSRIELEVLGRNVESSSMSNNFTDEEKSQENDIFPPDRPPVLKSILKRPGSGVSIKSCTSLGVMSLDSGMARLAASLMSHKNKKQHENPHKPFPSSHDNEIVLSLESNKKPDLSTLPMLGTKQGTVSSSQIKPSEESQLFSVSPSKSVSFKLDAAPKERDGTALKQKRGDARWGVALSSHQQSQKNDQSKVKEELCFQKSRTTSVTKAIARRNRSMADKEKSRPYGTAEPSTASAELYSRPHADGGLSTTQIHRLSDPYRKYLITRATKQSERYNYESNTSSEVVTTQKAQNRDLSEARAILRKARRTFAKHNNLDKHYMPMSYQTNNASMLPSVNQHEGYRI